MDEEVSTITCINHGEEEGLASGKPTSQVHLMPEIKFDAQASYSSVRPSLGLIRDWRFLLLVCMVVQQRGTHGTRSDCQDWLEAGSNCSGMSGSTLCIGVPAAHDFTPW